MGLSEQKDRMIFGADPRNTHWSTDKSRFGFKMLEKMGWSEGKGLGANESGMTEHVKIKLKSNNHGVGADKKSIRNWLANADGFSELLTRLNSTTDTPSPGAATTEDDPAPEKKSKKRKAKDKEDKKKKKKAKKEEEKEEPDSTERVLVAATTKLNRLSHRSRFRHMKKLALQDEKGLQEILGIRSASTSTFAPTPDSDNNKGDKKEEDTMKSTQTIATGVSMSDYFAKKMTSNPALAAIYGGPTVVETKDAEVKEKEKKKRKDKKKKSKYS